MKCPFTRSSVSGFIFAFFPCCEQHFTWCSALAFLACFLSTFFLIFKVHLCAASSRSLTLLWYTHHYFCLFALSCGVPPLRQLDIPLNSIKISSTFVLFHHFFERIPLFALLLLVSIQSTSSLPSIVCLPFFLYLCTKGVVIPCCILSSLWMRVSSSLLIGPMM